MSSDIKLDDDQVTVECRVLKTNATDVMIDNPDRRKNKSKGGFRRALVHDTEDVLAVNFEGDYSGGVRIDGPTLTVPTLTVIHPKFQEGKPDGMALFHNNFTDVLIINHGEGYKGGVKIDGSVKIEGPHLAVEQLRVVNPKAKEDKKSPGGRALVQSEDNALVINEGGFYKGGVRVEGDLKAEKVVMAEQFRVVNPKAKESKGSSPGGRALAQDEEDALVINQGGFYKGGVRVEGSSLAVTKNIALDGQMLVTDPADKSAKKVDLVKLVLGLQSQVQTLQKQVAELQAKLKGK